MGKPAAELVVKFYRDPRTTASSPSVDPELVSVTYRDDGISGTMKVKHFLVYFLKVLFNLGGDRFTGLPMSKFVIVDSVGAPLMLASLEGLIDNHRIASGNNVLQTGFYSMELVGEAKKAKKKCKAKFSEIGTVTTHFSMGGEDYYPPLSVLAFLQHLLNTLSDNEISLLAAKLGEVLGQVGAGANPLSIIASLVHSPL